MKNQISTTFVSGKIKGMSGGDSAPSKTSSKNAGPKQPAKSGMGK